MSKISGKQLPSTLNLPTVAPAFNWDFANGTFLNPRIAFSRNSAVASHFNELGVLKSDSANIPRFEYVQNASKGLLIEAAATNLLLYSDDFSNAYYVKTNATISANAILSPSGALIADKLIETAASGQHLVSKAIALSGQKTIVLSVFAKKAERAFVHLNGYDGTVGYESYFNLNDGTVTATTSGAIASIVALNDGWFKCTTKFTTGAAMTSLSSYVRLGNVAGAAGWSYLGDGTSGCYIFGLEAKETNQSSYIPTTSAAVTRALDLATVTGANFDYWRTDEYSFLVAFTGNSVGTCCITEFHDGTANERIYLESNSGALTLKIVDGGVEQCSLSLGTVVTGTEYRVAVAIKLNDIAASINGAACVTDTSATLPTITAHNLGSNYAGANQMNGTLSLMRGYAERLPNSQLETLTL